MVDRRKSICLVVATPLTVQAFLVGLIERLCDEYDITVVAAFKSNRTITLELPESVDLVDIPIMRQISPRDDLLALYQLLTLFRRRRFDLVHSVTPKAGLLAMISGYGASIPIRIHTFTGQVWATRNGIARTILKTADRIIARLATRVYADSSSQADFLATERVAHRPDIGVVADGSISGVDTRKFRPRPEERPTVRSDLGIPENAFIILFLGRISNDKGISELLQAFERVDARSDVFLLLVGPDESGLVGRMSPHLRTSGRVRTVGHTSKPESYLAASDLLAVPSYREGFGMVVIEAAACGVPAVATRIYGLTDAVADGKTGLLVEPRDTPGLALALNTLVGDEEQLRRFGQAARSRVVLLFNSDRVIGALIDEYRALLAGL